MSIAERLLPEFDSEMKTTRTLLEVLPEDQATWKPHPKSFSLADLATHVANLVTWTGATMRDTELDLSPPGGPAWTPPKYSSKQALLETFDQNVAEARAALAASPDEAFSVAWTLKNGGHEIFSMPRIACMRFFIMNHLIHHRGQLSVYLRLLDVPLPRIYGPTADTPM